MKISIAMAAYNGAKYIQEQLDSFAAQTQLPDELVVCDDASSDETIAILTRFAQAAPFNVIVVRNEQNLGFAKNFGKALSLCSGDYIFLSDQDDIWFPNKLEVVTKHMKETGAQVVINDMAVSYSKTDIPFSTLTQLKNNNISPNWYVNGCATTITHEFKKIILPIPDVFKAHDEWINFLANYLGVRSILNHVLQLYRRHETNTARFDIVKNSFYTNVKQVLYADKEKVINNWRRTLNQNREYLIVMKKFGILETDHQYIYLCKQSRVYENRIFCLHRSRSQRVGTIAGMIFTNRYKYCDGWRSAIFDLLV